MPSTSDGGAGAPSNSGSPAATPSAGAADRSNPRNRHRRDRRGADRPANMNMRRYPGRFEGREPSLKGFIYDSTGERNPDQYIKTTKEITSMLDPAMKPRRKTAGTLTTLPVMNAGGQGIMRINAQIGQAIRRMVRSNRKQTCA